MTNTRIEWADTRVGNSRIKTPGGHICSMGDLFHEDVPDKFIAAVFGVMACSQHHTFYILTKRPRRMMAWFSWIECMVEEYPRYTPSYQCVLCMCRL